MPQKPATPTRVVVSPETVVTLATPRSAVVRLAEWRSFGLVDGRRRQARGDLAVAHRALEARTAGHAPTRDAARALVAALATFGPLETVLGAIGRGARPVAARLLDGATLSAERGHWLGSALEALGMLADGDLDAARAHAGSCAGQAGAKAQLFVALGALRARLGTLGVVGTIGGEGSGARRALAEAAGACAVAALAAQDPGALDPAAIPLLDAHARGVFDVAAAEAIERLVHQWQVAATDAGPRAERELRRWCTALAWLCPHVDDELFPALRAATGDRWPAVSAALRAAALSVGVDGWCAALDGGRGHAPNHTGDRDAEALALVDAALTALIAAPDEEETALATRIRDARAQLRGPTEDEGSRDMLAAVVVAEGDRAVDREADWEAAVPGASPVDGPVDEPLGGLRSAPFGQWLATLAVAPDRLGASPALRRWAAIQARSSILSAFDQLVVEAPGHLARGVAVVIQGWNGRLRGSTAGAPSGVGALAESLLAEMRRRGTASELAIRMPNVAGVLLGVGVMMIVLGLALRGGALATVGVAALVGWRLARLAHERRRARARTVAGMAHARASATLQAVTEEWAAVGRDRAEGLGRLPETRERLRRALA